MGRTKNLKRQRRDDDDESSDQEVKSTSKSNKKAKASRATDSGKDDEGNSFWGLGGTRRATISAFKGKTYINIREYYTDASGTLKPGKKGIMLSPEQYVKLVEAIPSINAELRNKGLEIPDLPSVAPPAAPPADAPDSEEDDKPAKKTKSEGKKANIEATSEEDSDSD
ncbi:PC4-domain-containing protein [Hypoxylon sp. FL1857]|nr:PC4-domain-containing protein [Hypoxylon sp. FL1857]